MNLIFCLVLLILAISSEEKPVQFNGYPEENRNVKSPFSRKLFQGDILIDPRVVSNAAGRKRGLTKTGIWPNGIIPYTIDTSFSQAHKNMILSAMQDWENGTCLSFVPFTNENVYVKIAGMTGFGCSAFVGYKDVSLFPPEYIPFGLPMSLEPDVCMSQRVVRHELGHVIGFWHEHSRPDRDNYVNIIPENILPGRYPDFAKQPSAMIDSLGSPYDLKSIMHYGPKTFSSNGDDTIEAIDPNETLQDNEEISFLDKQQVNQLYNCP
ncbi:zinc metalloproteinase nas-14-like [Dendronephthya gigantea]|uniref:zinc metalloproteinase nas-14-like n=1 Tax=Dendronephthya gigantea TaxID=151771 RepID=UPI001068DF32|nr:zinc metalloproteinase nas-14-like [Dendronephthya gigantea]